MRIRFNHLHVVKYSKKCLTLTKINQQFNLLNAKNSVYIGATKSIELYYTSLYRGVPLTHNFDEKIIPTNNKFEKLKL